MLNALVCVVLAGSMLLGQTESRTTSQQAVEDLAVYRQHVETLANPFMEGRGPGTKGNRMAAEYFQWQFKQLGLTPAFSSSGSIPAQDSYLQEFNAGKEIRAGKCSVEVVSADGKRQPLMMDSDFSVLGNSGSAEVEGEVVFVGYSLAAAGGQGGPPDTLKPEFASYGEGDDLKGKIALLFRYEPMDESGKSLLAAKSTWSDAAAISQKIMAAVERGAAGIIVVSPPGVPDPRSKKLETTIGSERWTRSLQVPCIMLSQNAAERLVNGAEVPGLKEHSLLALRQMADAPRANGEKGSRLVTFGKTKLAVKTELERVPRVTWNVGGVLPGKGALAEQYVVIGGHFDHVGYGYTGGTRSGDYGTIHPGADDNASGASGVLLAARMLAREYQTDDRPRRSIMFLGFSAEEMGLLGSIEFVKHSPISASAISVMLNMDMIGRMREKKLDLYGTGTAEGFVETIKPMLDASGFTINQIPTGRGPSDHSTFYGAGIPVLHFFTGFHDEYHTPKDTADLINCEDAVGVARLCCDIARNLATRPLDNPLKFTSTDKGDRLDDGRRPTGDPAADAPPKPTVRVRFGVRPSYGAAEDGVLVEDVTDGTAAAEAGIQKDDLLTKWNGKPMLDAGAMMDFLREHKPGDLVDITLKRKGEEMVVRVTLKSRDQAVK